MLKKELIAELGYEGAVRRGLAHHAIVLDARLLEGGVAHLRERGEGG